MHPNPAFRKTSQQQNLDFARQRGFGMLTINGPKVPLISHIPFLLSEDGKSAEAHLVRSNPILRALNAAPIQARLAVSGPDAYISPDWYEADDQVPTWNYVAVHLSGSLEMLPAKDLLAHLDRLSEFFEARLLPKPIWLTQKVAPEVLAKMMRMIAPVRLNVTEVDGTWKLAQTKGDEMRLAAADGLRDSGIETLGATIAALMADLPQDIA